MYPKFQISIREKEKGHNGIRSIMGNADSPKQRINCSCSEAAELKLQKLNEKTLKKFQARFAFVQLHLGTQIETQGGSVKQKST